MLLSVIKCYSTIFDFRWPRDVPSRPQSKIVVRGVCQIRDNMKEPLRLLADLVRGRSHWTSGELPAVSAVGLVIRLSVGVLLLTTACLKIRGYGASSLDLHGAAWYSNPLLEAAAIQWELLLGLWLISGQFQVGSRIAALATFSTFALRSLYLGWIGEVTCDCFGSVKTSPWFAFSIDSVVLPLLVVLCPRSSTLIDAGTSSLRRLCAAAGLLVLAAAAMLGSIVTTACWALGGAEPALAYLRNETLSIRPSFVDFGDGKPGDELEATVEVGNWSGRPVRLIGAARDCSFLAASELPVTISPKEKTIILLKLHAPPTDSGGVFRRTASLWADDGGRLKTIQLTVGCRVRSP